MQEIAIHAQPHQVLRAWQSFRLGEAVFFFGLNPNDEQIGTGQIRFFDSDSQCVLGLDGMVWHIPVNGVFCQDFEDCTSEILDLMSTPRSARHKGPCPIEGLSTGSASDASP